MCYQKKLSSTTLPKNRALKLQIVIRYSFNFYWWWYTLIEHEYGNHCSEYDTFKVHVSKITWMYIFEFRERAIIIFLNNRNEQKELLVIQKWYHHAGVGMQDSCEGCCISPFYFSVFARCYVCNKRDFYCIMVKLKWL